MTSQTQSTRRPRRRLWRWLVVVAAVIVAAALWVGSHMPDDDASPEEVVQAYANALHWRDCITAARLAPGGGASWCGVDVTDVRVDRTGAERTDRGEGPRDYAWVRVQMNVRHGDAGLLDGPHTWGYVLDRVGPHGAWRIVGQGNG